MNSSLSKLNVQIAAKSSCQIFDDLAALYILLLQLYRKEQVKWASNSLKGQINPFLKWLFMEMFAGLLKRLEMRLKIGCCLNQESDWGTTSYILCIKWLSCYSEVRRSWHIPKIDPSYAIFSIIITRKLLIL